MRHRPPIAPLHGACTCPARTAVIFKKNHDSDRSRSQPESSTQAPWPTRPWTRPVAFQIRSFPRATTRQSSCALARWPSVIRWLDRCRQRSPRVGWKLMPCRACARARPRGMCPPVSLSPFPLGPFSLAFLSLALPFRWPPSLTLLPPSGLPSYSWPFPVSRRCLLTTLPSGCPSLRRPLLSQSCPLPCLVFPAGPWGG